MTSLKKDMFPCTYFGLLGRVEMLEYNATYLIYQCFSYFSTTLFK